MGLPVLRRFGNDWSFCSSRRHSAVRVNKIIRLSRWAIYDGRHGAHRRAVFAARQRVSGGCMNATNLLRSRRRAVTELEGEASAEGFGRHHCFLGRSQRVRLSLQHQHRIQVWFTERLLRPDNNDTNCIANFEQIIQMLRKTRKK